MKTKLSFLLLLLFTVLAAHARQINISLSAKAIPEALKKKAHAVMRYDKTSLVVKGLDKVVYLHSYAVTILDEKGKQYAAFAEGYNQMVKIGDVKGRLLDADGKELKTIKEKDLSDHSTFGTSFVFHSDSRVKSYDFQYNTYPYTVEYEIEETIKTTFFLPDWQAQGDHDCAVESTEFTLAYPADLAVRYKEYLMPVDMEKTVAKDEDGLETVTWKLKHIAAYEPEPFSREGNYDGPTVAVTPSRFELLTHKGDMQSWGSLGAFIYELNKNRDVLPEDKKAMVRSLTANETDTYAKIQKLYSYMQQNTRYVANEYGIAGWQTFDAESVARNGYGDCKGLTNYLKAMLKEAGINAYAALVFAGENPYHIDEQFPANTFNHVILCVPQAKDSIWVECTSQQLPAGYLGSFTQNRKVLLTTENGGYLCATPAYDKDKSYALRHTSLQLDNNTKQQKVTLRNLYSGLLQDDLEHSLKTEPEEKIREMVNSKFTFPSYNVSAYRYKHSGTHALPAVEEEVEATVSGITSSTQKRTFVNIAWMRHPMTEIFQMEPRTRPLVLQKSFFVSDSITVILPEGSQIEALPKAVDIVHPFAEYHVRLEKTGDKIILIREYGQNKGVYDAALFEKYQQLYHTIGAEKDKLSIVLLNKPS